MNALARFFKLSLVVAVFFVPHIAAGQDADLDELYSQLRDPDTRDWESVEDQIWSEWSKSGSPSFDLLLERGREALEAGDTDAAIEHLTALTDHAPDFAEGWNARATAYFNAEMYGPSLSDIERTLALNPNHFAAVAGMAMILDDIGYPRDALSAYRAAAAIHPHRPDIKDAMERLEQELAGQDL
ncbi:MAG: hypothetical protein AAGH83_02525 [Pseudomonadota bacterium]